MVPAAKARSPRMFNKKDLFVSDINRAQQIAAEVEADARAAWEEARRSDSFGDAALMYQRAILIALYRATDRSTK